MLFNLIFFFGGSYKKITKLKEIGVVAHLLSIVPIIGSYTPIFIQNSTIIAIFVVNIIIMIYNID